MTGIYQQIRSYLHKRRRKSRLRKFEAGGKMPWSEGYSDYKELRIAEALNTDTLLLSFGQKKIPVGYGLGIDERIVEYPWIFSQLSEDCKLLLDAGSTFNFEYILKQKKLQAKKIHICTYHPESPNFNEKGVSYIYNDIRDLPYKDDLFDEIVCQSTIEHIDMDNSIYGYSPEMDKNEKPKSYSYIKAINELVRILKSEGILLLTFPFGKFENHIFFQQFDVEMLSFIEKEFLNKGNYEINFIRYLESGWVSASKEECLNIESYNPHTGKGKGNDGAAHCRCVCLIKFKKY